MTIAIVCVLVYLAGIVPSAWACAKLIKPKPSNAGRYHFSCADEWMRTGASACDNDSRSEYIDKAIRLMEQGLQAERESARATKIGLTVFWPLGLFVYGFLGVEWLTDHFAAPKGKAKPEAKPEEGRYR